MSWVAMLWKHGWALTEFLLWMRFCGCCYERPLLKAWSWNLSIHPRPIPSFGLAECNGGWRLELGWFRVWWLKPGQWMRHDRIKKTERE